MSILILEFVERANFVAELNDLGIKTLRLEIESEIGEARGDFGNAPHTIKAVATAISTAGQSNIILRWQQTILFTDSLSLRMDADKSRSKLFENFEKVRDEFAARGFTVLRGQWKVS